MEPHQGVEGELPGLVLLPLLEHLALPHPDLEHPPHPRHHALTNRRRVLRVMTNDRRELPDPAHISSLGHHPHACTPEQIKIGKDIHLGLFLGYTVQLVQLP